MTGEPILVTRRGLFKSTAAFGIARPAAAQDAGQQPAAPVLRSLNRFPRMVQEYFVTRARAVERAALERKNSLKSRVEAEQYVLDIRGRIRQCFGTMPDKTPLNPKIAGVVDRGAYRIEKIIFESRPRFLVTANLYIPGNRRGPLPGVIASCGHSDNGKANEAYQSFVQGLARLGYVVLIFDPIGQGERLQYPGEAGKSIIGSGVAEHLALGNQQVLVGENFAFWRAWDGIRALDYLLTREEVDPRHVGVTGNSGGGTLTAWLCGLEPRFTMAAPGCFITTFRRNLENELPADIEQYPPRCLSLGLDMDDFLAAMAPKPVIILAKERDYFDVRGAEEAYQRLRRLYALLGAEQNIALHVGPTGHGFTKENREAMYSWFNRATGKPVRPDEPQIAIEKDETLWCTPGGSVASLGSRNVPSFTREISQALAARRAAAQAIPLPLRIPERKGIPDFRILRRLARRDYPKPEFTAYAVETEPGIHVLVYRLGDEQHYSRPPRGPRRAVLYVAHQSSDEELRNEAFVRELVNAEPDAAFYTCDVRGIGESRPDTCGENQFLVAYGSDYFCAGHALMLGTSYVEMRVFDILRIIDWLKDLGHEEIHLAAKGWGTIPATFAALISDRAVFQVSLKNPPASFSEIAEAERYRWPLSAFPPGFLQQLDLPVCYAALRSQKGLRILDAWNALAQ